MTLLKTLGFGLTGKFSNYSDLQPRFIAFAVFSFISIGAFTFDAWISYSVFAEYLSYVGAAGHIPGLVLSVAFALAATVSVGVVAFAFVTARCEDTTGGLSDSLKFAGYIAAFLYLTFAAVSILANIQGAKQAAERHADNKIQVDDSPIRATTTEWTSEKQRIQTQYDNELANLNARIDAINDGTSTEKAYDKSGKRGAVLWEGNKTPYGYALLEDLRAKVSDKEAARTTALESVDEVYQKRLQTEQQAFDRASSKHSEKKEKSLTAMRMIVFLIYPIALLISIFNAHFLIDVKEIYHEIDSGRKLGKITNLFQTRLRTTAKKSDTIGFKLPHQHEQAYQDYEINIPMDFEQWQTDVMDEMKRLNEQLKAVQHVQPEPSKDREILHKKSKVILSKDTPYNLGKKYNLNGHEKRQLNKVNRSYMKLYTKLGKRPSYTAMANDCGLDRRTVKKYVLMIEEANAQDS